MKLITKFQDGGQMGAPAAAPAETAAPAPEMGAHAQGGAEQQITELAGQLLESLLQSLGSPDAVMAVLQAAMDMLNQAAGQAPVFAKGGKLKAKGGCKMKANAKK